MEYSYKIIQDINRDAWNWWNGCNRMSHGVDWKTKIDREIVKNIYHKSQREAYDFLIPLLQEKYLKEGKLLEKQKNFINRQFKQRFTKGYEKIIKVMGKPLYCLNYKFYLTTFERAPYDMDEGAIWMPINWKDPMSIFLHELCHFQFTHYWRKNPKSKVAELSDKQFDFLKESLTVILDKDFLPIIQRPDQGYKLHQAFRKELSQFWQKEKDFHKLVEIGTKKVVQYI